MKAFLPSSLTFCSVFGGFPLKEVERVESQEVANSHCRGQRTVPERGRMAARVDLCGQHGQTLSTLNLRREKKAILVVCAKRSQHDDVIYTSSWHTQEF